MGWNGPGPFLIENNYLEAAGENIMFGGNDPSHPAADPDRHQDPAQLHHQEDSSG